MPLQVKCIVFRKQQCYDIGKRGVVKWMTLGNVRKLDCKYRGVKGTFTLKWRTSALPRSRECRRLHDEWIIKGWYLISLKSREPVTGRWSEFITISTILSLWAPRHGQDQGRDISAVVIRRAFFFSFSLEEKKRNKSWISFRLDSWNPLTRHVAKFW